MTAAPGCPVIADFDPPSPAYLDVPCAVLAALPLAAAPVFYAPSIDYHVVTRRNPDQHLAFGRGLHYCLGAHLGKLETRIVLAWPSVEMLRCPATAIRLATATRAAIGEDPAWRGRSRAGL